MSCAKYCVELETVDLKDLYMTGHTLPFRLIQPSHEFVTFSTLLHGSSVLRLVGDFQSTYFECLHMD